MAGKKRRFVNLKEMEREGKEMRSKKKRRSGRQRRKKG